MKKQELEIPSYQPNKVNLQRGVFSTYFKKHNQYSAKQIDQIYSDISKQNNISAVLSPKSNEISLSYYQVKKYDNEGSESSPTKKSNLEITQNTQSEIKAKSNPSISPSKAQQTNSNKKNQVQLISALSKDFDDKFDVQNTFSTSTNPFEEDEMQQQQKQDQYFYNQIASLQEFQNQYEDLTQNFSERSQVIEDLREQIQIEQSKLNKLEEELVTLKIKNEIIIKGDEKQNDVALKKLQILKLKVQQKEESEQEEVELRLKINEEFEYINEQIRFLEAENQLESESLQEELLYEKQKQAQLVKQLEKINQSIEESRSNRISEEEQEVLIEQKSEELKELGDRRVRLMGDIKEVQEVYEKLEEQYQICIGIAQGEFELEQNEYDIVVTEQNLLISSLIRDFKILSEFTTSPYEQYIPSKKQPQKNEQIIIEENLYVSQNQNGHSINDQIEVNETIKPAHEISQQSLVKINSAILQRMQFIENDINKTQSLYNDSMKRKEQLISEIAESQLKYQERQSNQEKETKRMQLKMQQLESELKNNQSNSVQLENELKELDSQIEGNQEIIQTYSANIENSNAQIKQLQERIVDYQNQVKQLQEQYDKSSKKKKKK